MRQQFNLRNNFGQFLTFQTNSSSGTTFDPLISVIGNKRCHWDLGNGESYIASDGIFYTYPNNDVKNVKCYVDNLKNVTGVLLSADNLIGELDFSGITLGGIFGVDNNPLVTGITFTYSNSNINGFTIYNCNVIGTIDVSMFPNLGVSFSTQSNPNLNYIIHTATTRNFNSYVISSCDILGTHDISMLSNFGGSSSGSTGYFYVSNNPNLNNINFPIVNTYFENFLNSSFPCVDMSNCDFNYVNFKPLSGATFVSGVTKGIPKIVLSDNNMSAGDVNHILDDFKYNVTNNPTGWSNVNLNIGGSNSDPDSSSGGYDGLAAISFLTGSPYNWTITY